MLTETITWIPVASGLPDADLTVHVTLVNNEEPTWLGYFNGERWLDIDNQPVDVIAWAEMLKGYTP